ncbi:hypothetical protein Tco_0933137 [Tanacetum coccineum]
MMINEKKRNGLIVFLKLVVIRKNRFDSVLNDVGGIMYRKGDDTRADVGLKHGLRRNSYISGLISIHIFQHVELLADRHEKRVFVSISIRAVSILGFQIKSYCSSEATVHPKNAIMEEHRASMKGYKKVHEETVRSRLRMAIVQQSMEIDMWEIKEKLAKRREQMAIRAYEEDRRREEPNQKIEEWNRHEEWNRRE